MPLSGRTAVSWARRMPVRAGRPQASASARPRRTSRAVGPSACRSRRSRSRSAPSAAWAGVTP